MTNRSLISAKIPNMSSPQKIFEESAAAPKPSKHTTAGTRKKKPDPSAPTPDSDWQPSWKPRKRPVGKEARRAVQAQARRVYARDFVLPEGVPGHEFGKPWDLRTLRAIIAFVKGGGTVVAAAPFFGCGAQAIYDALSKAGLTAEMDEARRVAADALVEQALHVASEPQMTEETTTVDTGEKQVVTTRRFDNVYARKLAYEARMKIASKWAPDRYGDKLEVKTDVSTASAIAAARRRLAPDVVDVEPAEKE